MLSLLAPWFLAGLAAIGVPIMVHLIQKERKEVIPFPSLMFLQRIPYQAVRRQKIRHWFLLLLRCLAVLLLVLAFTRPFFMRQGGLSATAMKMGRDVIILLDRSYSMEYGDRWRRAQEAAKEAVNNLGGNDRAVVVYFNNEATVVGEFTSDKSALARAIDTVLPTAGVTRYDVAFRAAQRVFSDTTSPRREVVLISDQQRSGWGGRELPQLSSGATLTQVDLSDSATSNVFVTRADVRYLYNDEAGRERVVVSARLVNRSDRAVMKYPVKLEVNDRQIETKVVDLVPNGTAAVEFDEMPIPPGISRGIVRGDADSLQRDNQFNFVLARKQSLPVLVVESPNADTMSSLFVSRALAIGDRPSLAVKKVRAGQLSADLLKDQVLVVLNDVPFPSGSAGNQLVEYVKNGGGLIVTLGGKSEPNKWPSAAGQLMARPDGSPIDRMAERGATFGFIDRSHPVFEVFSGPRTGDFSAARFFRYWPVTAGPEDRQLARYGDSRPALLERRVGKGRVLLWTSDMDGLWNDVPLQPIFLPFLRQAATYAAGYQDDRLIAMVGQALSPAIMFGDDAPTGDSVITQPSAAGSTQYTAIMPSKKQVRFGVPGAPATLELAEQGFYEIKRTVGSDVDARLLAVNVDLNESDLASFDPTLLDAAVAPKATEDQGKNAAELMPRDLERRQSVWWYLVILALVLLGIETLLSNRLSRSAR